MDPWSDESVFPPPLGLGARIALAAAIVAALAAFGLGAHKAASDIGDLSLCRYSEAREGVPGLEKLGISKGDIVRDGWRPSPGRVEIRHVASEQRHGTVLDASWCPSRNRDHLVLVIDR
jgi:hypothetical protein